MALEDGTLQVKDVLEKLNDMDPELGVYADGTPIVSVDVEWDNGDFCNLEVSE